METLLSVTMSPARERYHQTIPADLVDSGEEWGRAVQLQRCAGVPAGL